MLFRSKHGLIPVEIQNALWEQPTCANTKLIPGKLSICIGMPVDELPHRLRTSIPIFAYFSLPFYTKSTPRSPLYSDKPPHSFPFVFIHSFTLNPSALLLHIPVCSRSHVTRHATPGQSRGHSQAARTFALTPVQNISLVNCIALCTVRSSTPYAFRSPVTLAGSPVTFPACHKTLQGHIQLTATRTTSYGQATLQTVSYSS